MNALLPALKTKYPDISFYTRDDFGGITIYLYKKMGPNNAKIGTAVTLSSNILANGNEHIIGFMLDEAVKTLRTKENEINKTRMEWNPSSRKVPEYV